MNKVELKNRFRGSVFGLAIGDALGAPLEFLDPVTSDRLVDMESGAWGGRLQEGDWTDDTSLALSSDIVCSIKDWRRTAKKPWRRSGWPAFTTTISEAIRHLKRSSNAILSKNGLFASDTFVITVSFDRIF